MRSITFPTNVKLRFDQAGSLNPLSSTAILKIQGAIEAPRQQIFFNALPGQGTIDFTGNPVLDKVVPEWWGASPTASADVNTPAIQAAIYGSFGCGPVVKCRFNGSNLQQWNKPLEFGNGFYKISGELKLYHVINFVIRGQGRLTSGLEQTASNQRILDGQSDAYGYIENIAFSSTATQDQSHCLIDLGYSGSAGSDMRPQFIKFHSITYSGNAVSSCGLVIAKEGGGAQGNNINVDEFLCVNFTVACIQVGSRSAEAFNAIQLAFTHFDCQGNFRYCINTNGASGVTITDGTTEDDNTPGHFGLQTGYDFYLYAEQEAPAYIARIRTEDVHVLSGWAIVDNISAGWLALSWDTNNLAGTNAYSGELIGEDSVSGNGKYYVVTQAGKWGGLGTTRATRGSSSTIACSSCSWHTNQWQGQRVSIVSGNGSGYWGIVTTNSATTITVTKWITYVPVGYYDPATYNTIPDSTSKFIVEPDMDAQTRSGTVEFAPLTGLALDGAQLYNSKVAGMRVHVLQAKNDVFSRRDWCAFSSDNSDSRLCEFNVGLYGSGQPGVFTGEFANNNVWLVLARRILE